MLHEDKQTFDPTQAWSEIKNCIEQGLSLIPVRDKPSGSRPAKTPFTSWKLHQTRAMGEAELFQQMAKYNTMACAIITGKVSKNAEVVDIDEKHAPGISAKLLTQIQESMPETFKALRIHRTPSGGHHILYHVSDHDVPGNLKLAWASDSKEASIETRGESGYVMAHICHGYSVFKDAPIPTITWQERCSLIAICRSFNENPRIEAVKPLKVQSEFYDSDPFEDFNQRDGGHELSTHGWTVLKQNEKFIHYTRPGKTEGVSASFNKQKNIYFIFTSSTEFEPSRGYFPSMVLSKLKFNGDHKECYRWLVQNGYGKVNKQKELKTAKEYAKKNQPLPNNFSAEAKAVYEVVKAKQEEAYPYGEFIKFNNDDEKWEVSREAFYAVAGHLGFRIINKKPESDILKIEEQFVRKCTEREFFDTMKEYIKNEDPEELERLFNIYEKFIQKNGGFSINRLPEFDPEGLIKDDRLNGYLFFRNGFLHITSAGKTFKDYSELDQLVFKDRVKDRDFTETEDLGIYYDFIDKAVGYDHYIASIIGFLCHNFKDETTGYLPVFGERCENPKDGGGAGKNVLCNSLGWTTSYINKNCAGVRYDEKFLQIWNGQKILGLSDLPENFNFLDLKEAITGSATHKRLFKDQEEIQVQNMPKMVCQTNYAVEIKDGGIGRRVCLVEFTDFFTRAGGVDTYYGKHFPNDFDGKDWNGYDNVIANCIQTWISKGCKIDKPTITATGWRKRFAQTYGPTISDMIPTLIDKWKMANSGRVTNKDFRIDIKDYYEENDINVKYHVSTQRLNLALEEYCKHHGISFSKIFRWSENGIKLKGRGFDAVPECRTFEQNIS